MIKTIINKISYIRETLSKEGPEAEKMEENICIAGCFLFLIVGITAIFMFLNYIIKNTPELPPTPPSTVEGQKDSAKGK